MRSRKKEVLIVCGLALIIFLAWKVLSRPMLLNIHDPRLLIWNPIRNRAPEHYGVELLLKIQSDNCRQAMSVLEILEREKVDACEKQARSPVASDCPLLERDDNASSVWLLFHCPYKNLHTDARAEVALTLER